MKKTTWLLIVVILLTSVIILNRCIFSTPIPEIPLYESFEKDLTFRGIEENRFTKFVSFTFTKGDRIFTPEGFFNGENHWKVRFMPDETGLWEYKWSFGGKHGKGKFLCTEKANPKNHGHARRDSAHPRYLVYDDGTPHYWFGGKWINALNYGPQQKKDEKNPGFLDDLQFLSYLDTMELFRHNGLLLKNALFPLEDDKITFDLSWINRGEWLVEQMAKRGIYCQINIFDTWSREKGIWFKNNTDGKKQVFNVWDSTDYTAKENYIRTLIARYSGYYNVYWELGNEMEHSPNKGSAFVKLSNEKYIPWIRKYDPYHLPVALSEKIWKQTTVDIGLIHQTNDFPAVETDGNRPVMINELVRGGIKGVLARDTVIRDKSERLSFRRTFWRYFTYGGCGSTEATWLFIDKPLNEAVINVMEDQMRLRDFIDKLPVNINEMDTDTGFVEKGPGSFRTRGKEGECYVTYFLLDPGTSVSGGTIQVSLPEWNFEYRWYDPATGNFSMPSGTGEEKTPDLISHPEFTEDIVLLITKK